MRRAGRVLLCALVGLLLIPATQVLAHVSFVGSDPADGSVLKTAPSVADLHFSEEVLLAASSVTLLHLGPGTTEHLHITAVDGGMTLRATLPVLERGAYLLRFVAVDAADLHQTVGTVSFGVGVDAPPSHTGSQRSGPWWEVAVRAATDGFLIVGVGAVAVIWLSTRRRIGTPRRAATLATVCAAATSVGWVALFVTNVGSVGFAHARWSRLVFASDPGRRALISVELALGVWWLARLLRTVTEASRARVASVLAVICAGFVVLAAFGGHATVGGDVVVGTLLRTVHFASFCLWLGTVTALWWVARAESDTAELWPDASRIAAYGVALTGLSGLLLSARVVSTVTGLFGTLYGRAIVGKMVVLVLLAAFGWFAAGRVARESEPRGLPIEFVLAGAALVFAGILAGSAPAVGARFDPLPVAVPQIITHDVADLTVSASLLPARPGPNLVQLKVLDTRRPSPGPIAGVTMTLTRADGTVVATRTGVPDRGVLEWADVQLVAPGDYAVRVQVDRPAQAVPTFAGSWTVAPTPAPRAATVVSDRRWRTIAVPAAGVWLVVALLGRWRVRRRRQASNR